jgi:hypothetical protein
MRGHLVRLVGTLGQWVLWAVKALLVDILEVQDMSDQLAQQWATPARLVLVVWAALTVSVRFY